MWLLRVRDESGRRGTLSAAIFWRRSTWILDRRNLAQEAARHAFEDLHLHRVQIAIIPRNSNSRRVVEKLAIREEGTALRYLEINGVWEDHVRYAITVEEWTARRDDLLATWAY